MLFDKYEFNKWEKAHGTFHVYSILLVGTVESIALHLGIPDRYGTLIWHLILNGLFVMTLKVWAFKLAEDQRWLVTLLYQIIGFYVLYHTYHILWFKFLTESNVDFYFYTIHCLSTLAFIFRTILKIYIFFTPHVLVYWSVSLDPMGLFFTDLFCRSDSIIIANCITVWVTSYLWGPLTHDGREVSLIGIIFITVYQACPLILRVLMLIS